MLRFGPSSTHTETVTDAEGLDRRERVTRGLLLALADSSGPNPSASVLEWRASTALRDTNAATVATTADVGKRRQTGFAPRPLARIPENAPVKCVDWAPFAAPEYDPACSNRSYTFAFGSSTGRVAAAVFSHLNEGNYDNSSNTPVSGSIDASSCGYGTVKVVAEFTARPVRPCSIIAFGPQNAASNAHRVLSGLGKFRNEPCLYIWELSRGSTGTAAAASSSAWGSDIVAQFGLNDSISSAAWFPTPSPPSFVAGMSGKWIRIYDLRRPPSSSTSFGAIATDSSNTPAVNIATRAVNGIVVDPFDMRRFASFSQGGCEVLVWDTRRTDTPVLKVSTRGVGLSLQQQHYGTGVGAAGQALSPPVVGSVEFHPLRRGVLVACCGKDGGYMWDMREGVVGGTAKTVSHTGGHIDNMPAGAGADTGEDGIGSGGNYGEDLGSGAGGGGDGLVAVVSVASQFPHDASGTGTSTELMEAIPAPVCYHECSVKVPHASGAATSSAIAALGWIPHRDRGLDADLLLALNARDERLSVVEMRRAGKTAWACNGALAVVFGTRVEARRRRFGDIGEVIWERAGRRYGLDIKTNISILQHEVQQASSTQKLHTQQALDAWTWLRETKPAPGRGGSGLFNTHDTEYALLGIERLVTDCVRVHKTTSLLSAGYRVVTAARLAVEEGSGSGGSGVAGYFEAYSSEFRMLGLKMCGRFFETDVWLEGRIQSYEQNGDFELAAGIALFYSSSLERALKSLNAAKDEKLKLVSAALAGYAHNSARSGFAGSFVEALSKDLKDPYLRAIFTLLFSGGDWKRVLDTEGIPLSDQIGIALRFLGDTELVEYLQKLTQQVVLSGDLHALVLTGATTRAGVDLLERFIDVSGDFQSACLLALVAANGSIGEDIRLAGWVEEYRNLLDRYSLFDERAKFDIARTKMQRVGLPKGSPAPVSKTVPSQVHLRCNFCNNPISLASPTSTGPVTPSGVKKSVSAASGGWLAGNGCPHCRKPLPRCALCLMHMGIPTASGGVSVGGGGTKLSKFEAWFTWCQTCRHGGHADHMKKWFQMHDVCPVAGCACACNAS
ncbi:hypothetical protein BC830DRAFT_1118488 [Chytriomyces sp. MP71]|nr:hypothetical protein BC830DRAFT_1118488 [Chytriomyces sp. MP71]